MCQHLCEVYNRAKHYRLKAYAYDAGGGGRGRTAHTLTLSIGRSWSGNCCVVDDFIGLTVGLEDKGEHLNAPLRNSPWSWPLTKNAVIFKF